MRTILNQCWSWEASTVPRRISKPILSPSELLCLIIRHRWRQWMYRLDTTRGEHSFSYNYRIEYSDYLYFIRFIKWKITSRSCSSRNLWCRNLFCCRDYFIVTSRTFESLEVSLHMYSLIILPRFCTSLDVSNKEITRGDTENQTEW